MMLCNGQVLNLSEMTLNFKSSPHMHDCKLNKINF